jgi:hypothetical protein
LEKPPGGELAAVTRRLIEALSSTIVEDKIGRLFESSRLIEGLLESDNCPTQIAKAFEPGREICHAMISISPRRAGQIKLARPP